MPTSRLGRITAICIISISLGLIACGNDDPVFTPAQVKAHFWDQTGLELSEEPLLAGFTTLRPESLEDMFEIGVFSVYVGKGDVRELEHFISLTADSLGSGDEFELDRNGIYWAGRGTDDDWHFYKRYAKNVYVSFIGGPSKSDALEDEDFIHINEVMSGLRDYESDMAD